MLSGNSTQKLSMISAKESKSKQVEGGELLGHHLEIIAPANEESADQIMEIANEEVEVSKLIRGKSESNLALIKRYFLPITIVEYKVDSKTINLEHLQILIIKQKKVKYCTYGAKYKDWNINN